MEERYQEREEAQQLADMQELQSQLPDVELPEDAETEEPLFPDQQAMTNELPAQEDSEISEPIQVVNFHITDDALGRGTAKEKFRANIMAIQLLKKCESENRHATAEEQEILSRYVGWGGLADAFDESKPAWETDKGSGDKITIGTAKKKVSDVIYDDGTATSTLTVQKHHQCSN